MQNLKAIKIVSQITCPHCNQEMFACIQQIPAEIAWVLSAEKINKAKENFKARLEKEDLKMAEEEKKMLYDWVNNPDTMFSEEEIDLYINQLKESRKKEDEESNQKSS